MQNGNYFDEERDDAMDWSAFIAGGLIGAGVALLFAPQRGTELRSKLRDYADRAKDDLMKQGREVLNTAVKQGKKYYDKGGRSSGVRDSRKRTGRIGTEDGPDRR